MSEELNILDTTIEYFKKGQVILFVGAGISQIAGCYDWDTLIKSFAEHPLIKTDINSTDFIDSPNLEPHEKIQHCKKIFNKAEKENEYLGILNKAVLKNPRLFLEKYIPLIKTIVDSDVPIPIIVTTNVDDCLEETGFFDLDHPYYEKKHFIPANLANGSVFHIHGSKIDFKNTVFATEDYASLYADSNFMNFLAHIFSNFCIIFLGYGLRDKEIKYRILDVQNQYKCKPFYFLISNNEFNPTEITVLSNNYGLTVIQYGERDNFPSIFKSWIQNNLPQKSKKEDQNGE